MEFETADAAGSTIAYSPAAQLCAVRGRRRVINLIKSGHAQNV